MQRKILKNLSETDNNLEKNKKKWEKALQNKNVDTIKKLLRHGIYPENLNQPIQVYDSFANINIEKSLIAILLERNRLAQDAVNFDIADKLIAKGVKLPTAQKTRADFDTDSYYFSYLAHNDEDLFIALRSNPEIIKQQDEMGKTILHHAAMIGYDMGSNSASLIHYLLFQAPGVDFTLKDADGNTPVHIAALCSEDRVTCDYIFPNYVRRADELGFDFSSLGQNGQSVLHIATRTAYLDPRGLGKRNNVLNVLDNAKNINLDVLSASGSTAFFYAINWLHLEEAFTLIAAGANPTLYGSIERDPLAMVAEQINNLQALLKNKLFDKHSIVEERIEELNQLKNYILSWKADNKQSNNIHLLFGKKTKAIKELDLSKNLNTDAVEEISVRKLFGT